MKKNIRRDIIKLVVTVLSLVLLFFADLFKDMLYGESENLLSSNMIINGYIPFMVWLLIPATSLMHLIIDVIKQKSEHE